MRTLGEERTAMPCEHRSAQIGRPSSSSTADWPSSCGYHQARPALYSMPQSPSLMQRGIGHTPGLSVLARVGMHELSPRPSG